MDKRTIDLHVHSTESDGTFTPDALVAEALCAGLSAFALTDHDTVRGIACARAAAANTDLLIVPGIELSCCGAGREVHMVGLFIDENSPALCAHLSSLLRSRDVRNEQMIRLLRENAHFPISMEALNDRFPDCVLTRAHIARYLFENGYIPDLRTAFSKYIGDGCPYYVPREKLPPADAIRLIHEAGGIAILAHPLLYRLSAQRLRGLVAELTSCGLDGLEAIYSTYTSAEERQMKQLAADFSLAVSGGSDFHGANKPDIRLGVGRGSLAVPYAVLEDLRQRANRPAPPV